MEDLGYSGMGMSSVKIYDGQISGWKYQPLSGKPIVPGEEPDGSTGASTRWSKLAYDHVYLSSEAADIASDTAGSENVDIYTIGGVKAGTVSADADLRTLNLTPDSTSCVKEEKLQKYL